MAFDKSKDVCIKEVKRVPTKDNEEALIGIFSYNSGEPKIGVIREGKSPSGKAYFAALGRMTFEEAQSIIPALVEALEKMDEL